MDEQQSEKDVIVEEELVEELAEDSSEEQADFVDAENDSDEKGEDSEASEEVGKRISYIRELEIRLKKSQDTLTQYIAAYKSVEKDKEEFMARLGREKEKDLEVLRGKILEDLLVLMDSLDRSVLGAESARNYDALSEGIRMVQAQFVQKLTKLGVTVVPTVGEVFDPNIHEGLGIGATDDEEQDGRVLVEYSRGFMRGGRCIRPARVQVGKYSG